VNEEAVACFKTKSDIRLEVPRKRTKNIRMSFWVANGTEYIPNSTRDYIHQLKTVYSQA
jgi:hypothetical protein